MNDADSAFRSGEVFVQGHFAGILKETEDGYSFAYDSNYLESGRPAVSLTIPLQNAPFFSETLFKFSEI